MMPSLTPLLTTQKHSQLQQQQWTQRLTSLDFTSIFPDNGSTFSSFFPTGENLVAMQALSDRLSILGYDKDLRTRNKPPLSRYAVSFGKAPSDIFKGARGGRDLLSSGDDV